MRKEKECRILKTRDQSLRTFIRGGKLLDCVSKLANGTFSRVASRTKNLGLYNYTQASNRWNVLNFIVF
jgi:hypothetical protein